MKAEVEKVRSYGKARKKWSEKKKKPRIYAQHREPSFRYYPLRKEVSEEEKATANRSLERMSREEEERRRRRSGGE